jgi:hypothetical protein
VRDQASDGCFGAPTWWVQSPQGIFGRHLAPLGKLLISASLRV